MAISQEISTRIRAQTIPQAQHFPRYSFVHRDGFFSDDTFTIQFDATAKPNITTVYFEKSVNYTFNLTARPILTIEKFDRAI